MKADTETWEALGQAAPMVGALMQASADQTAFITEGVIGGLEKERDEWRKRAIEAETRLWRAQWRLMRIFGEDDGVR